MLVVSIMWMLMVNSPVDNVWVPSLVAPMFNDEVSCMYVKKNMEHNFIKLGVEKFIELKCIKVNNA